MRRFAARQLCYPGLVSEHAPIAEGERPASATEADEPAGAVRARRDAGFFLIAAAVVALDQVTKHLIRAVLATGEVWPDPDWTLRIINVSNSGAAFGILQGQTTFLVIMSLVGVTAIVLYYFYPPLEHGLLRLAMGLQLGGAAGNLIDRVRFVKLDFWPAFNVADASIFIGVATIFWFFLMVEGDRLRRKPGAGD